MKIEFDKALLWLVPYLYLVSILYYWGYWGSLEVDAINYYPTSDFVKGIVNPVSATTAFILGYSIATVFFRAYKKSKFVTWLLIILVVLLGTLFLIVCFYVPSSNEPLKSSLGKPILFSAWKIMFPILGGIVIEFIENRLKTNEKERKVDYIIRLSLTTFILLFPMQAHIDGRLQAWHILANQAYDYTAIDSVAAPKGIYKYLGKAGEHHFLMTLDNNERIIIPADKLTPLIIRHYDVADDSSRQRFAAYKQRYSLVPKQVLKKVVVASPPQQPTQPK